MTADVELLPLRDWMECLGEINAEDIRDYARANVAHATAAKDAEIEALRAEVESVTCELMDAITRADKLEEALRELVDLKDNVKHSFPNDYAVRKPLAWDKARALLRDQEE